MQIQTKLFSWPDTGDHVIMIARGVLDVHGLKQILSEVAAAAIQYLNCKVLIDLIDAECKVQDTEINSLLRESRPDLWPTQCKTALLSSLKDDHYVCLSAVSMSLISGGFRIGVFQDSKAAVDWLNAA